jgi:hypothetical protein
MEIMSKYSNYKILGIEQELLQIVFTANITDRME